MFMLRVSALAIVLLVMSVMSPTEANGSTWDWNTVSGPRAGTSARLVRVSVRIEAGLPVDADSVAAIVSDILTDDRSWIGLEDISFQVVADADPDLLVTVASPATTDAMCLPLNTVGKLSCRRGDQIILNVDRWLRGPDVYHSNYAGALDEYRRYLVNHEVGHYLGKGHVRPPCSSDVRAPVMMQQTFGLRGCAINGWPILDNASVGPVAQQMSSIAAAARVQQLPLSPWRFTRNPLRR